MMDYSLLMEHHDSLHPHWVTNHEYSFDQNVTQSVARFPRAVYLDHANDWPFAAKELLPPGLKWFTQHPSGPGHRATTYLCVEQPPGMHFVYLAHATKGRIEEYELDHEEHLLPLPWLYYRIAFNSLTRHLQTVSMVMSAQQITSFDDEVVVPPLYNLYVDNWDVRKDPTLVTCHGKVCLPDHCYDYVVPQSYGCFINDVLSFVWSGFNYDLTEALTQYARRGPELLTDRLQENVLEDPLDDLITAGMIHKEVFKTLTEFTVDEMCAIPTRQWERPMTFGRWLIPAPDRVEWNDVPLDFYNVLRRNYRETPAVLLEDCPLCHKD